MLRLQSPLPEGYTDAPAAELAARIAAAKAALGSRVFILGHHYQRDEVMAWAVRWPCILEEANVTLEVRQVYELADFGDVFEGELGEKARQVIP